MKIFFYAFANTPYIFNEVVKLAKSESLDIEWGMIYPRIVYRDSAKNIVKTDNILYLFENFNDYYSKIELDGIEFNDTGWIDNIYTILESSKFGYKKENGEKQLKVISTISQIYREFLLETAPDYVVFPDIETVNGVLLLNICKELNIQPIVSVHTRQLDRSFFSDDYRETLPSYFGNYNDKDREKAKDFILYPIKKAIIGNQREADIVKDKIAIKAPPHIFKRLINSIVTYVKYENKAIFDTNLYLRIRLNFEKYFEMWREFYFKYYQINFFCIKSDEDYTPKNSILILLQVTPESSINTYSQFFIEQDRMIDLIRLNMPTNFKLLVKEHPAMRGMRSNRWYKNMKKRGGVCLVSHTVNTRELMSKSRLVVTVTGSVGLECYHLDTPIIMFGPTFFSDFVNRFDSISLLKKEINTLVHNPRFDSKDKKIVNIAKIYNVSYDFFIHEPFHFARVLTKSNIKNYLDALIDHIQRLKERDNV
jgi:hypothetical protein